MPAWMRSTRAPAAPPAPRRVRGLGVWRSFAGPRRNSAFRRLSRVHLAGSVGVGAQHLIALTEQIPRGGSRGTVTNAAAASA